MASETRINNASQRDGSHRDDVFRLLVESVTDYAIFVLDPEGHVITWNSGAERIKGYSPAEILGEHFSIFYPQDDRVTGLPDRALKAARETGHWSNEGWRLRKDGSKFWASVVITALRGEDSHLVGFAKVTRDLTERKQAEEEREQLLNQERAAREEADRSIAQVRSIQSLTDAALAHLDLDELLEDLLDKIATILSVDTVAVLLLEDERPGESRHLVARAAKGIEEEVEQGVRVPLGKGFVGSIAAQKRPGVLHSISPQDALNPILSVKGIKSMLGVPLIVEGNVTGVLHVGSLTPRTFTEDDERFLQIVGDRVALTIEHARLINVARTAGEEARVAESQVQARDAFLSVAAHELKTPITTLRLAAQMLHRDSKQGKLDAGRLATLVDSIDQQSAHIGRLVGRLMDRVRIQHGRLELENTETDIEALLANVVSRLRAATERHKIELKSDGPVLALVDPVRLEQVFTNLIDNAIKFSPEGGPIVLDLSRSGPESLQVTVEDRGIGVPLNRRERLFERFYQAHAEDHRSGMGLGLHISAEIVALHGGTIHAEFPDEGGTRFVVQLPAIPVSKPISNTVELEL